MVWSPSFGSRDHMRREPASYAADIVMPFAKSTPTVMDNVHSPFSPAQAVAGYPTLHSLTVENTSVAGLGAFSRGYSFRVVLFVLLCYGLIVFLD